MADFLNLLEGFKILLFIPYKDPAAKIAEFFANQLMFFPFK